MLLSVKPRFGSHLLKLSVCESPGADVSRHNEAKLTFVTMLASQTLPPEVTDRHAFRYPTKALLADWPEVQYGWSRQKR